MSRDLEITYNGYAVGGSGGYHIDSYTTLERGYATAGVKYSFILTAATDAAFAAACIAAEAALRTPRAALVVKQGSSTVLSLSQTANTGLDAEPTVSKGDSPADSGRSRRYTVSIEFGQPADNVGTSGRRYSSVHIQFMPGRRTRVTVAGVYTATPDGGSGAKSAKANYDAGIAAYCVTKLAEVDSTFQWEKVEEPTEKYNETNKVLEFSLTFQQIITPDPGKTAGATTSDDDDLVDVHITITRAKDAPGDSAGGAGQSEPATVLGSLPNSPGISRPTVTEEQGPTQGNAESVHRPIRFLVTFDCWVKTSNVALKTKYDSVIRADLLGRVSTLADTSTLALVREEPDFDAAENRISCRMEVWAPGPVRVLEQRITIEDLDESFGKVPVGAWTGDPLSFYVYQGPRIKMRKVTQTRKVVGAPQPADRFGAAAVDATLKAFAVSRSVAVTPIRLGLPDAYWDASEVVVTTLLQFYKPVGA